MNILKIDAGEFESAVIDNFHFLERDYGFVYVGISNVREDPRDSYMSAKYRLDGLRVDIVWNPVAMALGIFIKLKNEDLSRYEKYIYFEPFVEFMSKGAVMPVVPQIYPKMSIGEIENAMKQRAEYFENGIAYAVKSLADRFMQYYSFLESTSAEAIKQYQKWYIDQGKAA